MDADRRLQVGVCSAAVHYLRPSVALAVAMAVLVAAVASLVAAVVVVPVVVVVVVVAVVVAVVVVVVVPCPPTTAMPSTSILEGNYASAICENSSVYVAFLFDKQISLACWQAHCFDSITVVFLS